MPNKQFTWKSTLCLLCIILTSFFMVLNVDGSSTADKDIQISLNGSEKGINLQGGCLEQISSSTTDFYIINGKIICLNGSVINGVSSQCISDDSISQLLSPDTLRYDTEAKKDMVYLIISPRGYFSVLTFTNIDLSKNTYMCTALTCSLDKILKQQIIESAQKESTSYSDSSGMDVIETGGMDVIETGGMDVIGTGGMDVIDSGKYDYFDTEISTDINRTVFEGKQIQFKLPPRKYSDGEILVLLKDVAPLFGLTTDSKTELGIETVTITKGSKTGSIQAYSDAANISGNKVTLTRAPKMDSSGILVPLSFLSKNFSIHFTKSEDCKTLYLSKNPIIEWKYSGYKNVKPYAEYESKYIDGVKTTETRLNGKNHVMKNVTLYDKKTGKTKVVPENKVASYAKDYSTTPPQKNSTSNPSNKSSSTNSLNSFFTRMNTHNFFQSSTFNTWGGQMIRRIAP